jgi:hypothetical protein
MLRKTGITTMLSRTLSWCLFLVTVLLLYTTTTNVVWMVVVMAQEDNNNGCTLCVDGSIPNYDAMIGETSCRTIANAIQQTPSTSNVCTMTQLQGYIYCNCPSYPTDTYCSLCTTTSTTTNDNNNNTVNDDVYYQPIPRQYRNKVLTSTLPITSNNNGTTTCGDIEFVMKNTTSDDNGFCTSLQQEYSEYCGCIGTTPKNCYLCNTNNNSNNENSNDENMLYINRLLPPYYTTSCGSFDRSLGLLSDCTTINDYIDTIPVPIQEYCGCSLLDITNSTASNTTPPGVCVPDTLCGNGQTIHNPNTTISLNENTINNVVVSCSELELVYEYTTNTTYCTELITQYSDICCSNTTSIPINIDRTIAPAITPSPAINGTAPTTSSSVLSTSGSDYCYDTTISIMIRQVLLISLLGVWMIYI